MSSEKHRKEHTAQANSIFSHFLCFLVALNIHVMIHIHMRNGDHDCGKLLVQRMINENVLSFVLL